MQGHGGTTPGADAEAMILIYPFCSPFEEGDAVAAGWALVCISFRWHRSGDDRLHARDAAICARYHRRPAAFPGSRLAQRPSEGRSEPATPVAHAGDTPRQPLEVSTRVGYIMLRKGRGRLRE